ncbi:MAG TPA: ABC transporter substrate-binding protein [Candidatus Saccharimonadales bacterium]|nr:ABC transporter substrate-binding protein [Candidatus Saccharimonadales bacterium]
MKLFVRATAFMATLVALLFSFQAMAQTRPDKVRIGYAARAVAHSVPFVAKEAGFFAEEGIDAEIVRTAGSIAPMALVANEVDLAIMSAYLMIPVATQNKDVVMLGGFSRYASMVFVARPDVKSAQDLKGKIVGIQRPGDAYEKSARFALRHLGLDADKDIKMLSLGSNDVMWSALQTGRVTATILSPPGTLFARKAGMNFMVDLTDLKLEYQGSTIATRRSFIQKNPQLATRALRAIVRGVHLFKTRKEDTMRILSKFLGTKDREALEESWDYASKMPAKPYAVESAVQAVLEHLTEGQARFAQYKPADFIDARLLTEIDKSGYIDRLYAGQGK